MTDDRQNVQRTVGYLEKRGKLKLINSWKKYWFVLEGHLLLYYGSKDDYDALSPCKGSITLGPTCVVKPYASPPIGFQITTRSTTVTLKAENINEQTKWMQAVLSTINQNQTSNKSPTKLNHFRYSNETVDTLMSNAETKKEIPSTPCSPKLRNVANKKLERKESAILDRLQKLGARSYSGGYDIHSQIFDAKNVKHHEASADLDESIEESKEKPVDKQRLDIEQLLPSSTNKPPQNSNNYNSRDEKVHIYSEIPEEKFEKLGDDSTTKTIVMDDEDFCVCTLGDDEKPEKSDEEPGKTANKMEDHIYAEPNNNHHPNNGSANAKNGSNLHKSTVEELRRNISVIGEYYTCDNEIYGENNFAHPPKTEDEKFENVEMDNEIYGSSDFSRTAVEFYYEPTEMYEDPDEVFRNMKRKESSNNITKTQTTEYDEENNISDVEYEELDEEEEEYAELKVEEENILTRDSELCENDQLYNNNNNTELSTRLRENEELNDNEIYSTTKNEDDNGDNTEGYYSEASMFFSQPDVECGNDIYGKIIPPPLFSEGARKSSTDNNFLRNNSNKNPQIYEKSLHLYSEPIYTETEENMEESEDNVYEDPQEVLVFRKSTSLVEDDVDKNSNRKNKKPNVKNEPSFKLEEHKKHDNLIQRLLKQAAKMRLSDHKTDKSEDNHVSDVDKTLVMLTNIQELLEKKKTLIRAMAEENNTTAGSKSKWSLLSQNMTRAKAETHQQQSPDLLQDLKDMNPAAHSGKLAEEYSVVRDKLFDDREDIYSEITLYERHSKELNDLLEDILRINNKGRPEMTDREVGNVKHPAAADMKSSSNGETT